MTTLKITDASFDTDVLQNDKPVVVDFWAEWCGPCKMLSPVLDELAKELDGQAVIGKLNIDDNPETPAKFGIRSIPTLMLFKNGKLQDTKTGVQPKSTLLEWVKGV